MANRYESDERWRRERSQGRQEEQFQPRRDDDDNWYGQMGDSWREYGEQDSARRPSEQRYQREREFGGQRDYRPSERFGSSSYERERSRSGSAEASARQAANRAYDATSSGAGSRLAANHGEWRDPNTEYRSYRDTGSARGRSSSDDDRGFIERAGDTLAHWLGDDADYGRGERSGGHRGRGPQNYSRSDDRIREDACDALTEDWHVDASRVEVQVESGEVTLNGTVSSREQKRRAEDCLERLSGVRHVQNNLRVEESDWNRTSGSQSNPTSTQA